MWIGAGIKSLGVPEEARINWTREAGQSQTCMLTLIGRGGIFPEEEKTGRGASGRVQKSECQQQDGGS